MNKTKNISENGHTASYDVADNNWLTFTVNERMGVDVDVDEGDVAVNELSDLLFLSDEDLETYANPPTALFYFGPAHLVYAFYYHSILKNQTKKITNSYIIWIYGKKNNRRNKLFYFLTRNYPSMNQNYPYTTTVYFLDQKINQNITNTVFVNALTYDNY